MAAPYGRYQKSLTDDAGNIVTSATVTVTDKSTGGLATLYSTRTGTGITNPTTSHTTTGLIEFYVANGRYDIAAISGAFSATDTDKEINTELSDLMENKQSYTSTYTANVYTVTPEINLTVWPALQAGQIVEFDLPTGTITAAASIDFNGTTNAIKHSNGNAVGSGDINSTLQSRGRFVFDGTDWIISYITDKPSFARVLAGGSTGKRIEVVSGILRKTASGTAAWEVLDGSGHRAVGIAASSYNASGNNLVVTFDKTYTNVLSFDCSIDESFAAINATVGASVGLSDFTINIGASVMAAGVVRNNGSVITDVETGLFSINPSTTNNGAGIMTTAYDEFRAGSISLSPYTNTGAASPFIPALRAYDQDSFLTEFIATPGSGMYTGALSGSQSFAWQLGFQDKLLLDGTECDVLEDVLTSGSSNIFFSGIFEV